MRNVSLTEEEIQFIIECIQTTQYYDGIEDKELLERTVDNLNRFR